MIILLLYYDLLMVILQSSYYHLTVFIWSSYNLHMFTVQATENQKKHLQFLLNALIICLNILACMLLLSRAECTELLTCSNVLHNLVPVVSCWSHQTQITQRNNRHYVNILYVTIPNVTIPKVKIPHVIIPKVTIPHVIIPNLRNNPETKRGEGERPFSPPLT
jgi:hypothetical protein